MLLAFARDRQHPTSSLMATSERRTWWHRLGGWLLDHIVGSAIGTFVTAGFLVRAVPSIWDAWNALPWWVRVAVIIAALLGLVAAWRVSRLRRRDAAGFAITVPPGRAGYAQFGVFEHGGVGWLVEIPRRKPYSRDLSDREEGERTRDWSFIREAPLCPRCMVQMSQSRRFWGHGFTWTCPACDCRLRSGVSWTAAAKTAEKAFKAQIQEGLDSIEAS